MPLDTLRRASTLLGAGQHLQAQQLLYSLLRARPDLVEPHWLLANSFFEVSDFRRAQNELQICMHLSPRKPEPYVLAGRLFLLTGQMAEAERVLRQGLNLDRSNLFAVAVLARVLLIKNRAEEARVLLEPCAGKKTATTELLMLYGHALMALGDKGKAAVVFRKVVRAESKNHEARFRLAAVLADSDQPGEAEAEARAGIAISRKTPDAAFVLARALMGQGKFADAEAELLEVVRARPNHVTAQSNWSELVWMRTGDVEVASAELDSALSTNPRLSALRITKARLLMTAQLPKRALITIEPGLALESSDPTLLVAASQIALYLDAARALDYARRALRVAPEDCSALAAFGSACLGIGNARQALETSDKLRQLDPNDGQVLSMQADAWRLLRDSRYDTLCDYRRFVRTCLIDTPKGWPDLPSYLTALRHGLECLHTLNVHPVGQSLRRGSQAQLAPEQSPDAAIRAFPQAIAGPIRRYMEEIGNAGSPFLRRNTGHYKLRGIWSVRLRPNGFHVNHYHPQGWLSSACYIHLPPAVQNHSGEGWLQFGEPAFPTVPPLGAEYFVKPEPGLLALFPSHMWHGTLPFSGGADDTRLTIAFDVVPS